MANLLKPTGVNNIWAITGTKTDPGLIKANTGWVVELPPYQTANWIEFRQDSFIAHSNQHGVPEWDSITEYQGNISYTKGSDGVVYKCLVTNTNIDPINPLNSAYWVRAFESYGSVAVVADALSAHLANYSTLAGIANTVVARTNLSVYSKTETDVRYAALAGNSGQVFNVATATLPAHAIPLGQLSTLLTQATEAQAGVAAIASNGDTATGTDDTKIITPLKAATVYLSKAGNLAGLVDVATARTNLGLGTMAVEAATGFLRTTNNLSDVPNKVTARANLGLTSTAIQPETYFNRVAQNLSDVPDKAAARSNLGLTDLATTPSANVLFKSGNLAGLTNIAQARSNLGLGDIATQAISSFLIRGNNLADLTNVQSARNNLQLGSAATRNVVGVGGDLNFSAVGGSIGWKQEPNGIIDQWGIFNMGAGASQQRVNFPRGFPSGCWNIQMTRMENPGFEGGTPTVVDYDANGFTFIHVGSNTFTNYFWRALGA